MSKVQGEIAVSAAAGKYESRNPISKYLVRRFDSAVAELVSCVSPATILEIGCGQGHVTELLLKHTSAQILATDISPSELAKARQLCASANRVAFSVADVEKLEPETERPQMVVCCEVLEHVQKPRQGLRAMLNLQAEWYLLSVPREPIWRAMNLIRGAYVSALGNTPGHVQHWSQRSFLSFLRDEGMEVVRCKSPLPWTVVLGRHSRR